jgi:hypothetical protein
MASSDLRIILPLLQLPVPGTAHRRHGMAAVSMSQVSFFFIREKKDHVGCGHHAT